ncbi:hypothetical protein COLO4_23032 [Corchorus olitorius]|uniref:F-box domain-containing protein n=1 Tax=Corchorus olitorius TaxID=93759 RepID=A0A1R3IIK7_9ROSI|nr:hypothetical protein COLO4_23032 [Corchorus olitorius]
MIISRREGSRDEKSHSTTVTVSRSTKIEVQEMRSYSDLPLEIVENIIRRLGFLDRIRLRGVCKDWLVLNLQIPSVDKYPYPWAMTSYWWQPDNDKIHGYCDLTDPPVRKKYVVEKVRGKEYEFFCSAIARASSYGWLLFENSKFGFFLYCPFTREVIKLPELKNIKNYVRVATFSLDATSSKCVIFTLEYSAWNPEKICINICCPGDKSWKTFKFMSGFESWYYNNPADPAIDAAYANGNFYCVFKNGELGAFNVGLEEWTLLTVKGLGFYYDSVQLIEPDGNLQLLGWSRLGQGK